MTNFPLFEQACLELLARVEVLEAEVRRLTGREVVQKRIMDMDDDDLFKPLSAKVNPKRFTVGGRLIENPKISRMSEDFKLKAALRNIQRLDRPKAGQ